MADKQNVTKDVLDSVKKRTTVDDTINRFLEEQEESFPQPSDIEVEFKYVDPFEVPKWADTKNYAFAWLDPNDDIGMHRALDNEHFRIVTRSSSCIVGKSFDKDFRTHGAVERQRMILAFRPKDLDARLRTGPIHQHQAMVESVMAGKEEEGYDTTALRYNESDKSPAAKADRAAKVTVVAEEGIDGSISDVI